MAKITQKDINDAAEQTAAKILDLIFDPCCGSGSFFTKAEKKVELKNWEPHFTLTNSKKWLTQLRHHEKSLKQQIESSEKKNKFNNK